MFTTETFVSQTALWLLKQISSRAEKCPSICLMAPSLEAKNAEARAAGYIWLVKEADKSNHNWKRCRDPPSIHKGSYF
jgi:hypothetical protein